MQKVHLQNSKYNSLLMHPLTSIFTLISVVSVLLMRFSPAPFQPSTGSGFNEVNATGVDDASDDLDAFDTPDAVTKEVPSPDGKWIGVLIYSVERRGKPGHDLFALRSRDEKLERNAEGNILSTLYAGKTGVEIQKAEWHDPKTIFLTLRNRKEPLPLDRVLARFRGIVVKGIFLTQ